MITDVTATESVEHDCGISHVNLHYIHRPSTLHRANRQSL